MLVFEERGIPKYPEKNLSEKRREPTTNSTHIIMVLMLGVEPGPHWWETSALTTVPPLLPEVISLLQNNYLVVPISVEILCRIRNGCP